MIDEAYWISTGEHKIAGSECYSQVYDLLVFIIYREALLKCVAIEVIEYAGIIFLYFMFFIYMFYIFIFTSTWGLGGKT
jgi:hypothetical protein